MPLREASIYQFDGEDTVECPCCQRQLDIANLPGIYECEHCLEGFKISEEVKQEKYEEQLDALDSKTDKMMERIRRLERELGIK